MDEKTILLVEDNPKDEALILRALKKNNIGNEVVICHDGAEALALLEKPDTTLPQLVLLDLKLPKIDGLEVLQRIRGNPRTKLLPVVILTSSTEEGDRLKGYSFGANSYIRKPVDFVEFAEAVRQVGLYWLIMNEPPPFDRKS